MFKHSWLGNDVGLSLAFRRKVKDQKEFVAFEVRPNLTAINKNNKKAFSASEKSSNSSALNQSDIVFLLFWWFYKLISRWAAFKYKFLNEIHFDLFLNFHFHDWIFYFPIQMNWMLFFIERNEGRKSEALKLSKISLIFKKRPFDIARR